MMSSNVRIAKWDDFCYVGEMYGTWSNRRLGTKWRGWRAITKPCRTKKSAIKELEKWKNQERQR